MNNYFFSHLGDGINSNSQFLSSAEQWANDSKKQVYVLSSPLNEKKYDYVYQKGYVVLVPGRLILFATQEDNINNEEFKDYVDDFKQDLYSIADKYSYVGKLGRSRQWNDLIKEESENNIDNFNTYIDSIDFNLKDRRRIDFLISLIIGSINDVANLEIEPNDNLLDRIKQKILLFDTDQTRFIYDEYDSEKKIVKIQGLSGTGKTELLMHRLKNHYISEPESIIGFTCHNKVLAHSLRKRINDFFNDMNVGKQIDWENRMLCTHAWGSFSNPTSGIYRYICYKYQIPYYSLREAGKFGQACRYAIEALKKKPEIKPVFTYLFIDESQDFEEEFIELCQLVTEKRIYIAGDIFQSIFSKPKLEQRQYDYLLSKCYRTDPKTLMIAQGLGMGLFEDEKLWWLDKTEWKMSGYNVEVTVVDETNKYLLTREPVRRFEDIDMEDVKCFSIWSYKKGYWALIKNIITNIIKEFPTVKPDDIAIIYLDDGSAVYDESPALASFIEKAFGWECNLGHETKKPKNSQLFISNRNNVKGLEFPFVICITSKVLNGYNYRNALYTVLSRSFLRTYLILPAGDENGMTKQILIGINNVMNTGRMEVEVPNKQELDKITQAFEVAKITKSLNERIHDIISNEVKEEEKRHVITDVVSKIITNPTKTDDDIKELVHNIMQNM